MYAWNYDAQDGLVNGVDGIVKLYTHTDKVDVLWIKFHDPNICHRQSRKLDSLYTSYRAHDWIPISGNTKAMPMSPNMVHLKIQKQLPVQLACACTIHRS